MKNLVVLLFVAGTIVFFCSLSSCGLNKTSTPISKQDSINIYQDVVQKMADQNDLLPIEKSLSKNIRTDDLAIVDSPGHEITVPDAKDMVAEYINGPRYFVHRLNRRNPWRPDTKCVWFGKDLVKALYDAVNSNDSNNVERNGIRIYFGVYDKAKYEEQTLYKSVIITVTKPVKIAIKGGDSIIANYDDLDKSQKAISKYWNLLFNYQNNFLPPYNRGGLCPPPNDSCKIYGALLLPDGK